MSVESNQVAVQYSQQDLIPDGQNAVNLRGREGGVEEESNLDTHVGTNFLSQHGWHKEEMEVMDPDNVSVLHIFGNDFSKYPVGFLVR